jgi:monoamine oxidase
MWTYSAFRWGRDGVDRDAGAYPPSSADEMFAHPGPLNKFDHRRRKRVCVVGAGAAGFAAAYELSHLGHHVTLLDAAKRYGGRIWTKRFPEGYGELGAMRLPAEHECVWHYVNEFGIRRRQFVTHNQNGWLYLRGQKHRIKDFNKAAKDFGLASTEVAVSPFELANALAGRLTGLLNKTVWNGFANMLEPGLLQRMEDLAIGQVARGSKRSLDPGFSREGWEFVGRSTGHTWLERTALLHWLREETALRASFWELVDGMEKLIDAFRARVTAPAAGVTLRRQARVTAIVPVNGRVDVSWWQEQPQPEENYGDESLPAEELGARKAEFDYVICTTPAHATTQIHFGNSLGAMKREALTNVSYLSAGKSLIRCNKRHWETLDGIYGGSSRTDLPIQQCWYPNDTAVPMDDGDSDHLTLEYVDSLDQCLPTDWKRMPENKPEEEHRPGVFLAAYMWGTNAQRFASLSDAERTEMVVSSIEKLHPKNKDFMIGDPIHWSWDAYNSPAGGAFSWFAPGEQGRYQAALCEPLYDDTGNPRIFFAGEHVGVTQGWIQGAIQSAVAATIHVLRAP